jgi:hypothetical protein
MKTTSKLFTITSLLILSVLVFVPTALAFDGRSGDRIIIGKDEVINDDLYLGAREVIVDGIVNGDLLAAGEVVIINGKVSGDLWAAGRSVTVNGEVGDDLFAAAAAVTIGPNARIGDDAFGGAASVEAQAGSQVGGSLLIGAGQALVSGQVGEDLLSGTNRLRLEGVVGRDAKVAVDTRANRFGAGPMYYGPNMPSIPSVPAGLTFGDKALVEGTLNYTSVNEQNIPGRVTSQVQYQQPAVDAQVAREIWPGDGITSGILNAIRRLVALLLVGLLIAWLAPAWILNPAGKLHGRTLPSMGVGLIGLIIIPIVLLTSVGLVILLAILLGALTLGELVGGVLGVGLPGIALIGGLFGLVLAYLPQAIVAYLGGRWILQRARPASSEKIYWPLVVGLLILGLVFAIPFLGGLIQFLVVLAGLGAIALLLFDRKPQPTSAPA